MLGWVAIIQIAVFAWARALYGTTGGPKSACAKQAASALSHRDASVGQRTCCASNGSAAIIRNSGG
jgi:hypothetical protein